MEFKQLLKEKGIKTTKSRIAVLNLLDSSKQPLAATQIFHNLKNKSFKIDLATIYRILEKFLSINIVKQVDFREGKLRYELTGDHHHHLVCQGCGNVEGYRGECLAQVEKTIKDKYKFNVTEHVLEFFGTCHNCQ
jgi:Fur family transcriptional regulator, ferric uptake regulator